MATQHLAVIPEAVILGVKGLVSIPSGPANWKTLSCAWLCIVAAIR